MLVFVAYAVSFSLIFLAKDNIKTANLDIDISQSKNIQRENFIHETNTANNIDISDTIATSKYVGKILYPHSIFSARSKKR